MLVSVQTCISSVTKDEEHSMCQIVLVCVIFNITVFITMVTPLSDWLCAWGYMYVDQTHTRLNYSETLVTWVVFLIDVCTAVHVP